MAIIPFSFGIDNTELFWLNNGSVKIKQLNLGRIMADMTEKLKEKVYSLQLLLQKVVNINANLGNKCHQLEDRAKNLEEEVYFLTLRNQILLEQKQFTSISVSGELDAFRQRAQNLL
ncbi:MAG: hypothetical protein V1851_02450 [Patescibacteria group bacterium]